MTKKDFFLSLAASFVISIYLLPTLINTAIFEKLPSPILLLFIGLPLSVVSGMSIASYIGKKILLLWQVAKFALVGVLNTAIDFGILNFLIAITQVTSGVGIIFINATSFSTALINSYFWNKEWVFGYGKRGNFVTFAVVTLIGLSLNTGVVYGLTTYVPPVLVTSETIWANVSKVLATFLSLVWNFTGYKLIVFKK